MTGLLFVLACLVLLVVISPVLVIIALEWFSEDGKSLRSYLKELKTEKDNEKKYGWNEFSSYVDESFGKDGHFTGTVKEVSRELFQLPLEDMPLFITPTGLRRFAVEWRLENGK